MEESTVNKIIDLLFSEGYWVGLIALFVFAIIIALYKIIVSTPQIKEAIAIWVSRKTYTINVENINKHHIFLQQSLMKNKVNSIIFKGDPFKSKVFQVFFATKLEVDIKKIKDFIKKDFRKLSPFELHIEMTMLIENMKSTYDKEIKAKIQELCNQELYSRVGNHYSISNAKYCSEKIFKYIMYSPKGYEEFRSYRIENLFLDLELLRESPIYDNNNERVYHFLDTLNSLINKAILRAGKIFYDFNGEIERIITREIDKINNK